VLISSESASPLVGHRGGSTESSCMPREPRPFQRMQHGLVHVYGIPLPASGHITRRSPEAALRPHEPNSPLQSPRMRRPPHPSGTQDSVDGSARLAYSRRCGSSSCASPVWPSWVSSSGLVCLPKRAAISGSLLILSEVVLIEIEHFDLPLDLTPIWCRIISSSTAAPSISNTLVLDPR
jgi:hypothetical protein